MSGIRVRFDAASTADDARSHGLVVVAGAGLSMLRPSSLPSWTTINDAFIENLALRVAQHTGTELGPQVANLIVERRDTADVAQPDLQAQLAEEELGEHYFALFRPLDIGTWSDGHAALAALARTGVLVAVVTTNFDRLIELALYAAGAILAVYCAPDDFDRLQGDLESGAIDADGAVPVIKVHGSVGRTETMVDTLRQRVVGRPRALEAALGQLFARHAVLVVGFSGADLTYDPHYLALRTAAADGPAFTVVNRIGTDPNPALANLVASGGEQSRLVDGELPGCLTDLAAALGHRGSLVRPPFDPATEFPGVREAWFPAEVHLAVEDTISPVRATVVLAAIAQAAGSTDAAHRLLTHTMPFHIRAGLLQDPALPEQLAMTGATLIEAAHIDRELSGDTFQGELAALQVLSAAGVVMTTESVALLALALALCGEAAQSDGTALRALRESRTGPMTARIDTICALARTWTLTERWDSPYVGVLEETYELAADWGDELRRARVGALLCRFLIETGALERAEAVLSDCRGVVERLRPALIGNDLIAVGGRLSLVRGQAQRAFSALRSAVEHLSAAEQHLRVAENLLPLTRAAAAVGDADAMSAAVQRFNALLPLMPGMALPRCASMVHLFCTVGAFDAARTQVAELSSLGERWSNPWVPELVGRLTREIMTAEAAAHP